VWPFTAILSAYHSYYWFVYQLQLYAIFLYKLTYFTWYHTQKLCLVCLPKFMSSWRMPSSGMWRRVDLVWTDVSEERIASIFRAQKSASEEPAWAGGCSVQVPVTCDGRSVYRSWKVWDIIGQFLYGKSKWNGSLGRFKHTWENVDYILLIKDVGGHKTVMNIRVQGRWRVRSLLSHCSLGRLCSMERKKEVVEEVMLSDFKIQGFLLLVGWD
jgi:hypothetical protein